MPIEYRCTQYRDEDLWCPVFVCDICNEVISESGNVEYKVKIYSKSCEEKGKPYFVHKQNEKGICCDAYLREKLLPCGDNEMWYWEDLDTFSLQLFSNFVDPKGMHPDLLNFCLKFLQIGISDFIEINSKKLRISGIYFLFDRNNLVYIGESDNIQKRLKTNHHIYDNYHKIKIVNIKDKKKRKEAERILVSFLHPSLNSIYNYDSI